MKVLLLSYYFPPAREVGALRAQRIAQSFVHRGATVHVITAPLAPDLPSDSALPGITVHRTPPALDLRSLWLRLRGRSNGAAIAPERLDVAGQAPPAIWTPPQHTPFLKRQLASALWLPDDRQGWILPAARSALRLARAGADLIYSTAPPFSVHLAAMLVKRRSGLPWVLEFRDPWTDNPWKPPFVRSAWSDAAERWLEARALRNAETIVTATESVADLLRRRLPPAIATRVLVVRSGIDVIDEPTSATSEPVRRVVYTGSLYHDRDPRPFFRALADLRRAGELNENLQVEFIGNCRWFLGASMQAAVSELGLEDLVTFIDPLPHEACMQRMRDADLLLLLAQNQPLQVPNKLYEYLGVRRPILAFADTAGETARMLRQLGGHFIVDSDEALTIRQTVKLALAGRATPMRPEAEAALRAWHADSQFAALHARLESAHP
jgi:glycosyltransferase involved in cell wall biosynthesis